MYVFRAPQNQCKQFWFELTTSLKMTLLLGLIMVQYLVFKRRPMKTVLSFLAHNGACPKVVALQKPEIFCYSTYYPYRCNISVRLVLFPFFTTLTFLLVIPFATFLSVGKLHSTSICNLYSQYSYPSKLCSIMSLI